VTLSPGVRLGPYEILSPLGAGGMGEVYKAKDTRLDRTVAIKVLPSHLSENPEVRQRFEREAKTISSLSHPHICGLYDVGHQDGTDYLVMEFLEGETLTERLAKGSLPTEQVLRYGIEMADALDKAHRQGVIHRDLKPGNIMLTKSGIKLVDFGLAKTFGRPLHAAGREQTAAGQHPMARNNLTAVSTVMGSPNLTQEGTILGTFQYMAPEQLEGKEADARTDIFAFGAVLYEMATGQKAFTGKSQASLIGAILRDDPPAISTLAPMSPPALNRVVKTCLAKDPEDRWQTAHDVMLELKWIAEGGSQAGLPAPVVARRKSRERLAWAGFVVSAVAAAAFGVGYFRRAPAPPQAFRSSLLMPEKTSVASPALSPDATRLVFVATGADDKPLLWVRPLSSLFAQPLSGTENAALPFWSPDSRSIGFFADGKLKRIGASGGPPLTLCDAVGLGGTWNRDGMILFALPSGPIHRVPASGGVPTAVTRLDASRRETTHRYPHFLPDGQHFLYLAANLAGGPQDPANLIRVASLDSKEDKPLIPAHSNTSYAMGNLLFVRDGDLLAQGFDAKRLRMAGEIVTVAQKVGCPLVFWRHCNFSASQNGALVYASSWTFSSEMLWLDREGRKVGSVGEEAAYSNPRISPDGRKVAVEIFDANTRKSDIWIYDRARGVRTRFTAGGSQNGSPVWSPDGSRILFNSDRKHQGDLYLKAAAGAGEEEPVLEAEGQKIPTDWSSDGRFIAFESREPKGERKMTLSLLPLTGDRKPLVFLKRGVEIGDSRFSPDGRWLAYTSLESGRWEVYVTPFPGPGDRWQISTAGGYQPRWRRDGKELFYLSPDKKLMSVEVKTVSGFEPGVPRPLFETGLAAVGGANLLDVSADGQRFLIVTPTGEQRTLPLTLVLNWTAELAR